MTTTAPAQIAASGITQMLLAYVGAYPGLSLDSAVTAAIERLSSLRDSNERGGDSGAPGALVVDSEVSPADYRLVGPERGFWVTVGSTSIYVRQDAEGVEVSVHPAYFEGCTLSTNVTLFEDVEAALLKEAEATAEAVDLWAKATLGLDIDGMPPDERADITLRFARRAEGVPPSTTVTLPVLTVGDDAGATISTFVLRRQAADEAFESYDFSPWVVEAYSGWEENGADLLQRSVFLCKPDAAAGAPTKLATFAVTFGGPNGAAPRNVWACMAGSSCRIGNSVPCG